MSLKWDKEFSVSDTSDLKIDKRFEISGSHMSSSVIVNGKISQTISMDLTTKDLVEIRDYINYTLETYDLVYKSKQYETND